MTDPAPSRESSLRLWLSAASPLAVSAQIQSWVAGVAARFWPKRETLSDLIEQWRPSDPTRPSSLEWDRYAPGTKRLYGTGLKKIESEWGRVPLAHFNDPRMHAKVLKWHERFSGTPAGADNTLTAFSSLLSHGMRLSKLEINVAAGVRDYYRAGQRADVIWTDQDFERFYQMAEKMGVPEVADALRIARETGFRLDDLITVLDRHLRRHSIIKLANKVSRGRRRFAVIPRTQALDAVLKRLAKRARADGVEHLLVTAKGKPWRRHQLDIAFRAVRDACGIVHVDPATGAERAKHLHDVRGTFATRLVTQTDLSDAAIAQIMAWAPSSVAQIRAMYVDHGAFVQSLGRRLAA